MSTTLKSLVSSGLWRKRYSSRGLGAHANQERSQSHQELGRPQVTKNRVKRRKGPKKREPVCPLSPFFVKVFSSSSHAPHTHARTHTPCPLGTSQNKRREKDQGQGTRVGALVMLMWFCPAAAAQGKPLGSRLTHGYTSER